MEQALLYAGMFLVAFLYASVGHGGASGYLAVLALCGYAVAAMKTSALALNLIVAAISFFAFKRAQHFEWKLFWPFAVASIPLSFVGGYMTVSPKVYGLLLASTLAYAAARLAFFGQPHAGAWHGPKLPVALGSGAGIGLLSGIVGVGGGIFLSPLMILMKWADTKQVAAVSALFIWVNSAAGLLGHMAKGGAFPELPVALIASSAAGGTIGAYLGANKFDSPLLRRILAVVLLMASYKLFKVAF